MGKKDKPEPDVKVHITKGGGCELDKRTDKHSHPQADWRALIDSMGDKR